MVIGVDPGIDGAIAVLDDAVTFYDVPTCAKARGRGRQVSVELLASMFNEIDDSKGSFEEAVVVIESVTATPQMGVTSAFSFGRSFGVIEGIVAALDFDVEHVTPQRWKRHFGLIGKDKDVARTVAIRRFPDSRGDLARKKDVGRADALLIALWYQQSRGLKGE